MSHFSRRNFLFLSSGAAAGTMLVPGAAAGEDDGETGKGLDFSSSGLVTGKPKALPYKSIPGFLSAEQIAPHHTAHYGGALRGYTGLDAALEKSIKTGPAIEPHAYGAMQRARTSKGNSVLLHEMYFDGMAAEAPDPAAEIRRAIEKRFGSLDRWADDFQASARAASGWAFLALHPVNGKLYNLVSNEHAQGLMWMADPLVVIDVYEHAFYVDYKNRKSDYVTKFMNHINWNAVGKRYRAGQA